ncbi:hypothetical protein RRF57_009848 [Xylaria bambusicola]|uniref:Chromo domain-containing protein n=1 Tax=Xylaria bambusicola TaxID=326684 RepID=A0AAN7UU36_9PEZI
MAHALLRRSRIEIPLPSKPRDYRPGDGPSLAPVRLTLENDTDAFIIEKRVLPGKPVNDDLKLELYYIVGWPNLPNARVAILATKILDYVSPRTLEDWEYEQSLEKDKEEEERLAAEKRKQEERARAFAASTPGTGTLTPTTPGQKKRGRPSKAEVLARQLAQQASFGKEELANMPLPSTKPTGPSLSVPKKLAQVLTDLEDLEETDMNEAILQQLKGTNEYDRRSESIEDLNSRPDTLGNENGSSFKPFLSRPSSRGYAEFLVSNPPSSVPDEFSRSVSPIPLPYNSKWTPSNGKLKLTTPVPVPTYAKPARKEKPRIAVGKTITPIPVPYPVPKPKSPKQKHMPITVTPVPIPCCPVPRPKKKHEVTYTPVPPPTVPKVTQTPSVAWAHNPLTPSITSDVAVRLNEFSGFPPADRRHLTWSTLANTGIKDDQNDLADTPSTTRVTPVAKPNSSHKRKAPQPEEDQEWEVKRLEGDKIEVTDGKLVRYYKVRWAGEWPEDQNPTWEPEENIPHPLVRKYLKKKAAKTAWNGLVPEPFTGPASDRRVSDGRASNGQALTFKKTYSNTTETFKGDTTSETLGLSSSFLEEPRAQDEKDDTEEFLQVTKQNTTTRPIHKLRVDAALLQELVDSFML